MLVVAAGNISNTRLGLLDANLAAVVEAVEEHRFVELRDDDLILHLDH